MRVRSLYLLFMYSCFLTQALSAHAGTPSSANGIGTIVTDDFAASRGAGGAGVANVSAGNMLRTNPALLGAYTRPSYGLGLSYDTSTTYLGLSEQPEYAKTMPSLLKFVLPVTRGLVVGWGLSPYSRTDVVIDIAEEPGAEYNDILDTSGGISMSSIAAGWKYKERLYLGISLDYHFGAIEERWKRYFPAETSFTSTIQNLRKKYKGYGVAFGTVVKVHSSTHIGIAYKKQANLDMDAVVHSDIPSDPEIPAYTDDLVLPSSLRIGVWSQLGRRLSMGVDYSYEAWEDAAETPKQKEMYTNAYRIGGGLRFIPSVSRNAGFLKRIPILVGVRHASQYYKSYPVIDTINETAVTCGFEIPLIRNSGTLVTTFDYGKRGDKDNNGWDETFMNVGLTLVGQIK